MNAHVNARLSVTPLRSFGKAVRYAGIVIGATSGLLASPHMAAAQFTAHPGLESHDAEGFRHHEPGKSQPTDDFLSFSIDPVDPQLLLYDLGDVQARASEYLEQGMPWFYPHSVWLERDANDIPIVSYSFGKHYNPVTTSQTALAAYRTYLDTGDERSRELFFANANWLVANQDEHYFRYAFQWRHASRILPEGWVSAMAQGQALGVLVRAFRLSADSSYLDAAAGVFQTLHRNSATTWTIGVDEHGHFWLEEYPNIDFCHVLNGFLFGLWGVWDYFVATGDEFALTLLRAGIRTVVDHVADWNVLYTNSSYYCRHRSVYEFYHQVHLSQFTAYASFFDIPEFAAAAELYASTSRPASQLATGQLEVDFGSIEVGESAQLDVLVSNEGDRTVRVILVRNHVPSFQVPDFYRELAPGEAFLLNLSFVPPSPAVFRDTLEVFTDDGSDPLRIPLLGTGMAAALSLDPPVVAFGDVLVGREYRHAVTVMNAGNTVLRIGQTTGSPDGLSLEPLPSEIAPGMSATVDLSLRAEHPGSLDGAIFFESNSYGGPVALSVLARAHDRPFVASSDIVAFEGTLALSERSKVLTVRNLSDQALNTMSVSAGTGAFASALSTLTLAPDGDAVVEVHFRPGMTGPHLDTLTISAPPYDLRIPLEATALSPLRVIAEHTGIEFQTIEAGAVTATMVEIENIGAVAVELSDSRFMADAPFHVMTLPALMAAAATDHIVLEFAPQTAGHWTDTLSIDAPFLHQPLTATVTGSAIVGSESESPERPGYAIGAGYPNPTSGVVRIPYSTDTPSHVRILLYNAVGQILSILVDAPHPRGSFTIDSDLSAVPAGLYFLRMVADGHTVGTRRVAVTK